MTFLPPSFIHSSLPSHKTHIKLGFNCSSHYVRVSRGSQSKYFFVISQKLLIIAAICYNRSIPCVISFKKMYAFMGLTSFTRYDKKIISKLLPQESQMEYNYMFVSMGDTMNRRCLVHENIISYLKNHWTKHRHVCTHCDAFSPLIPNMGIIF